MRYIIAFLFENSSFVLGKQQKSDYYLDNRLRIDISKVERLSFSRQTCSLSYAIKRMIGADNRSIMDLIA